MTEEKPDKTQVLLERVKVLEEKARWSFNMGFVILGSMIVLAKFVNVEVVRLALVSAGLVATGVMVVYAAILGREAERLWERLLRDPGVETKMLVLAGAALLAIGVVVLVAVFMGWW